MVTVESLDQERREFAQRQRAGVHFVAAATIAWLLITVVNLVIGDPMTRNLVTFCASVVLLPLAWMISKVLKIPFQDSSPLAGLGFLVSINQVLYLPIAMWVYAAVPDKLVMVLGIITAAHLLPFGWLYRAQPYYIGAGGGALLAFVVGLLTEPWVTALVVALVMAWLATTLAITTRRPR